MGRRSLPCLNTLCSINSPSLSLPPSFILSIIHAYNSYKRISLTSTWIDGGRYLQTWSTAIHRNALARSASSYNNTQLSSSPRVCGVRGSLGSRAFVPSACTLSDGGVSFKSTIAPIANIWRPWGPSIVSSATTPIERLLGVHTLSLLAESSVTFPRKSDRKRKREEEGKFNLTYLTQNQKQNF